MHTRWEIPSAPPLPHSCGEYLVSPVSGLSSCVKTAAANLYSNVLIGTWKQTLWKSLECISLPIMVTPSQLLHLLSPSTHISQTAWNVSSDNSLSAHTHTHTYGRGKWRVGPHHNKMPLLRERFTQWGSHWTYLFGILHVSLHTISSKGAGVWVAMLQHTPSPYQIRSHTSEHNLPLGVSLYSLGSTGGK